MKALVLAALLAGFIGFGSAGAQAASYHPPAHNYYQNNWVAGRG